MTYKEIQDEVVEKYRINLCPCSKCRGRMHAHVRGRKVCKWIQRNSANATFDLFHEIGHIETTTSSMRRCESEYAATRWALDKCREYGIEVPEKQLKRYQEYILRERDRGIRRGGRGLPSEKELTL